ncbi:MAG: regulatory protein RecX [Lentisphaerae bacterium]|nr:MAG: regulatory protein RecX [Lentisphaerota bacterium]
MSAFTWREALRENDRLECYNYGLNLLSRRAYTQVELKRKLSRRFPPALVAEALNRYAQLDLLNDERFALEYTREKRLAGYGIKWIRNQLRRRGVDRALIDEVLSRESDDDMDTPLAQLSRQQEEEEARARILQLARRQWQRHQKDDPYQRWRKVFAFLARRGFPTSECKEIIDTLRQEETAEGDDIDFHEPFA